MIEEDGRVAAVREYLATDRGKYSGARKLLEPLLAYAEERLRVNVGLMSENAALKKKLAERDDQAIEPESAGERDCLERTGHALRGDGMCACGKAKR